MIFLRALALFIGAMFLQWWWNTHLAYWGAAPNILLSFTILIAARRGPVPAMLLGYIWGIFTDTLHPELFGANALLFAWAGYLAGTVRRQMDLRATGPLAATVFLMTWAYALAIGIFGQIFLKSFLWVGWTSFLATPFLNTILVIVGALAWEVGIGP
jgi:rod shape-determining protein MreD